VLPDAVCAVLRREAWPRPAIFDWLQRKGQVHDDEMQRVFNCGIGMVLIVEAAHAQRAISEFAAQGEQCRVIGVIEPRVAGTAACRVLA